MSDLNPDLYSVIFIALLCNIGSLFFFDKNKMVLLTQLIYKTDYHSLYITRNLQFTFFRFLFLIFYIISTSTWINLILKNQNIKIYTIITIELIIILSIRKIITLLIGYLTNTLSPAKKLILITIDIEFLICMFFFPIIVIVAYIPYNIYEFQNIAFFLLCFFLIITKYFLIKKFNHLKDLSFFNIILYLCCLDFIPIISLYKILN